MHLSCLRVFSWLDSSFCFSTVWIFHCLVVTDLIFDLIACMLSCIWLFVTPCTVTQQAPLSIGLFQQEYWSGLPFPFPEALPNPEIELTSLATPALTDRFFITSATWEAQFSYIQFTYWRTACFQVLVVMNKVHNKHAREGFCVDINLLDLTARVCLALFKKKKNCQTVFQCGCTILYSHQQWMGVPVAPHSYQHLMLSVFWMLAIFIGVQWYLIVVLICISLICRGSIWCGAYFYTIAYHLNIFFGEVSVQVLSHF